MTNRQRTRERLQRGGIGATDEVLDLLAPLLDEVRAEEREACANECLSVAYSYYDHNLGSVAAECEDAVRSRK